MDGRSPIEEPELDSGQWIPAPHPDGPYAVKLHWGVRDGTALPVAVSIVRTDGEALGPTTGMSRIRWREVIEQDRDAFRAQGKTMATKQVLPDGFNWVDSLSGRTVTVVGDGIELVTPVEVSKDGRRLYTDDHYREIADLHREAAGQPNSLSYVVETYNKQHGTDYRKTTVRNWVRRAREKGFL
jgi:hypothetical protein